MTDPIQVYENHSGPIPPKGCGLRWLYVAYRDAENDQHIVGYGNSKLSAVEDFCRNEAEAQCAACTGCQDDRDCILTSGQLAQYIKTQQAIYINQQIGPDSIAEWKALKRSIQTGRQS